MAFHGSVYTTTAFRTSENSHFTGPVVFRFSTNSKCFAPKSACTENDEWCFYELRLLQCIAGVKIYAFNFNARFHQYQHGLGVSIAVESYHVADDWRKRNTAMEDTQTFYPIENKSERRLAGARRSV